MIVRETIIILILKRKILIKIIFKLEIFLKFNQDHWINLFVKGVYRVRQVESILSWKEEKKFILPSKLLFCSILIGWTPASLRTRYRNIGLFAWQSGWQSCRPTSLPRYYTRIDNAKVVNAFSDHCAIYGPWEEEGLAPLISSRTSPFCANWNSRRESVINLES